MTYSIELDEYEIANLQEALRAIGYPYEPNSDPGVLGVLNSGDWVGQIALKLPNVQHFPNRTYIEYQDDARRLSNGNARSK